jgi:excisionase family DNA binding protein
MARHTHTAPATSTLPRLLTVREVAEVLHWHPIHVYRAVGARRLPCVRIGRSIRIREDVLTSIIERATTPARRGHEL